jgi:archaellum biogenesis ATPase FlaH
MNETQVFFDALFSQWLDRDLGEINIRAFKGKDVREIFTDSEERAVKESSKFSKEGFDVFTGINLRVSRKGTKDGVKYVTALHSEVDYGSEGHAKPSKHITYGEALTAIAKFPLQPSLIIHSGGGFHPYWLLKEAIYVPEIGADKIETIIKNISNILGGDTGTQDISRLLRVVGTYNYKIAGNPRAVTIIQNAGPRYELNDFAPYMEEPGESAQERFTGSWDGNLDTLKIPTAVKLIIKNGVPKGQRSEALYSAVCSLVKAGLGDTGIKTIILNNAIGEKAKEKGASCDRWLQSQIEKAKGFTREQPSKGKAKFCSLNDLEEEFSRDIDYLWRRHIPLGMPVTFNGREGDGKTTAVIQICNEILADNPDKIILWIASEGFVSDTINKMNILGCDRKRLILLKNNDGSFQFNFSLPSEAKQLDDAMRETGNKIIAVVIDSIRGITPFDDNDSKVKNVMMRLNSLVCDKSGASLIYIDHHKKGATSTTLDKAVGSTAKTAAVRRVFSVLPISGFVRKIECAKSNILGDRPVDLMAALSDERLYIYESEKGSESTVVGQAEKWLIKMFSKQTSYRASDLYERGKEFGFSDSTLKTAKGHLGISSSQGGVGTPWNWTCDRFKKDD